MLTPVVCVLSGGAFNWCFYSASAPATSPSFTISASGTMFTGAYSSYLGRPGWQVLYMTGTRLQTLNGVASTAFITGVAPQFSFAGNDNVSAAHHSPYSDPLPSLCHTLTLLPL